MTKARKAEKKEEPPAVTIDLDGIGQRIVALPIRPANYIQLDAGKTGILFLSEIVDVPRFGEPPSVTVSKFDLSTRKTEPYVERSDTALFFCKRREGSVSARDRRRTGHGSSPEPARHQNRAKEP